MNTCICISPLIKKCFPIIESQSNESNESDESDETFEKSDKSEYYIDSISGKPKKHTSILLYFQNYKKIKNERICSICFDEEIKTSFTKTKCNHYYHSRCLKKWCKISNSCPICRFDNIL